MQWDKKIVSSGKEYARAWIRKDYDSRQFMSCHKSLGPRSNKSGAEMPSAK